MTQNSDLGQKAKEHVSELGEKAKVAASEEAVAQAEYARDTAANKVQQAANAADAAAAELDPASPQAQAVQHVADSIEGIAHSLRGADVREVAAQATQMARRHPALFMGGAALAGFAAARFLKSRDPQTSTRYATDDPWQSSQGAYASPQPEQMGTMTDPAVYNGGPTRG